VPYTLVVEAQDALAYRSQFPGAQILVIQNDRGLGYSRQQILSHCRQAGHLWHWQIDDDMLHFKAKFGRRVDILTGLRRGEFWLEQAGDMCAILGFRHEAWPPVPLRRNMLTAWCVCVRTDTGIDYESHGMRQDADFCLSHIVRGWTTAVVGELAWVGRIEGQRPDGTADPAYPPRAREAAQRLKRKYPGLVDFVNDGVGEDLRIHWELLS
jgi:hypothetical protein